MFFILGQAIPPNTSLLGWMVSSLSTMSTLIVIVMAVLLFVGAYRLVSKRKPVASLASYLILLPLPLIISVCDLLYSSIGSLATIASTPNLVLTNDGIAGGLAACLCSILFSILVTMPTYILLAYGLIARGLRTPTPGASTQTKAYTPNPADLNAIPVV